MVILGVKAKEKESGKFVEFKLTVNDDIRNFDNDALYEFIYKQLVKEKGDVFKWFRFWTV